jgi:hypothetical protein
MLDPKDLEATVGKTVAAAEQFQAGNSVTVIFTFTDGSRLRLSAWPSGEDTEG